MIVIKYMMFFTIPLSALCTRGESHWISQKNMLCGFGDDGYDDMTHLDLYLYQSRASVLYSLLNSQYRLADDEPCHHSHLHIPFLHSSFILNFSNFTTLFSLKSHNWFDLSIPDFAIHMRKFTKRKYRRMRIPLPLT